jgi:hypothetical protein
MALKKAQTEKAVSRAVMDLVKRCRHLPGWRFRGWVADGHLMIWATFPGPPDAKMIAEVHEFKIESLSLRREDILRKVWTTVGLIEKKRRRVCLRCDGIPVKK